MSNIKLHLLVDDREREIASKIEDTVPCTVKRLPIGDYIIVAREDGVKSKPLLIIERKTYEDFAASIKDGRHYNKDKMLSMSAEDRNSGGCSRVAYIVEGRPNLSYDDKIGGIPRSTIESAVIHLFWRDNIQIFFTSSLEETVQFLINTVLSLARLHKKGELIPAEVVSGGNCHEATTPIVVKSPSSVIVTPWAAIEGISAASAAVIAPQLSSRGITIASILAIHEGDKSDEEKIAAITSLRQKIMEVKLASGRSLTEAQVNNIIYQPLKVDFFSNLLSSLPGFSKKTVEKLEIVVNNNRLKDDEFFHTRRNLTYLLALSEESMADLAFLTPTAESKSRRLGPAKSKKIIDFCGVIEW